MLHAHKMDQPCVSHVRRSQSQRFQLGKTRHASKPPIGHSGIRKIQVLERRQVLQVFQAGVRDQRLREIKVPERLQPVQVFQSRVVDRCPTEVQTA